jgi:hypothetical protein
MWSQCIEIDWIEVGGQCITWRWNRIEVSVRVLATAGEAEQAVVKAVGRGGGSRVVAIGGDGGGRLVDVVVVVEIVAEVEGRGDAIVVESKSNGSESSGEGGLGGGQARGRGRTAAAGGGQAWGRGRTAAAGGGQARGRGSFFLEILRSRGCAGEAMAVRDARCAGGGDGRLTRGKARRKSSLSFILFRCRDLPILKF